MVAKRVCASLGTLILAAIVNAAAAEASEATTVADRAGFLIGHAQRCGVAEHRLERSVKRLTRLIAAFSSDDEDRDAAQARFAESMTAGALAQLLDDKLPSCPMVRSSLTQLEKHRDQVKQPVVQMAREDHRNGSKARGAASAGATPGKAARRNSKREELSAERGAARFTMFDGARTRAGR